MVQTTEPVDEELEDDFDTGKCCAGGPPETDEPDDDGEGRSDGPWVTVATFWQPPAAHIARLRLEADGIECALIDENMVATDWLMANALGGIKLQVPAAQATRAAALLSGESSDVVARDAEGEPLFDGQTRCPQCGSTEIYPVRVARRWVFLSLLLLGAPLPILARRTRCAGCGFEWR